MLHASYQWHNSKVCLWISAYVMSKKVFFSFVGFCWLCSVNCEAVLHIIRDDYLEALHTSANCNSCGTWVPTNLIKYLNEGPGVLSVTHERRERRSGRHWEMPRSCPRGKYLAGARSVFCRVHLPLALMKPELCKCYPNSMVLFKDYEHHETFTYMERQVMCDDNSCDRFNKRFKFYVWEYY